MNPKASALLEKACEERHRSNFKKAIDRLEEGVEKYPGEFSLYTEAIDVGMEAGESLRAIQIFKKAQHRFPDEAFEVWAFAAEKVGAYNDSIMGRFLVEHAVKTGDLAAAASILGNLKDHAVSDLLERIRIKKQTMSVASGSGPAGRGETVSFTLTEALLSFRLGHMQAAMDGFVGALEENPAAAKKIEPFLADFESHSEGKGETSFALGCCFIERADFPQGLAKLAHAARSTPSLAPRVIERIESIEDSPDLSPDLRDLTLAQLYLGQGERTRASQILKRTIERTPRRAADAVDLLRGSVETIDEDLETQFVFIEAAFTAGRRETALGQLRKIHGDKRHTARLVEWLESRTKSQSGSTEVRLFFAETALNEGLYGKAVEIFKEILSHGTQEEAIIRDLLSRHQSVPVVRAFYTERFAEPRAQAKKGAFEVERYEGQGFHPRETGFAAEGESALGSAEDDPPVSGAEPLHSTESLFHQAAAVRRAQAAAPSSDFDNHDFSLTMHEPATPAGDAPPPAALADDAPAPSTSTEDVLAPLAPAVEMPAADSSALDDAGSSDFFDYLKRRSAGEEAAPIDTPPAHAPEDSPPEEDSLQNEAAPQSEPAENIASEDDAVSEDEEYRDFDSLYRAFLNGRLDHTRIIDAASRALDEGRMDEMKHLLSFEPANLGEDIARKYHLARYYLEKDQPLPALVALKTVHLNSLGRDERKDFMLRIAECYRALYNFDAAHGVYLRIMTEHPGLPGVEALARANYARYVETATGSAAALEKTTTL